MTMTMLTEFAINFCALMFMFSSFGIIFYTACKIADKVEDKTGNVMVAILAMLTWLAIWYAAIITTLEAVKDSSS